jgi:hypothetical protein
LGHTPIDTLRCPPVRPFEAFGSSLRVRMFALCPPFRLARDRLDPRRSGPRRSGQDIPEAGLGEPGVVGVEPGGDCLAVPGAGCGVVAEAAMGIGQVVVRCRQIDGIGRKPEGLLPTYKIQRSGKGLEAREFRT